MEHIRMLWPHIEVLMIYKKTGIMSCYIDGPASPYQFTNHKFYRRATFEKDVPRQKPYS